MEDLLAAAGLRRGTSHGTGLFATRDLPGGFCLRVPLALCFSASSAAATPVGGQLTAAGFDDEEICTCVLAQARRHGTCTPMNAWIARMPFPAPDVASWPRHISERLLGGTDLGMALSLVEDELNALSSRLAAACGVSVGVDELRWARGTLLSRRFYPAVGEPKCGASGLVGVLIPLLDELNHSPKARVSLQHDGEFVSLRNPCAYNAGEEVYSDYGSDKSNEELLAMYGFALPSNPADAVSILLCPPAGPPVRHTLGRSGVTPELWATLLGEEEGDVHELFAVTTLRSALVQKLAALDTAEPAAAEFAQALGDRGTYATLYRRGIREVLIATIAECDEMAEMLADSASDSDGMSSS